MTNLVEQAALADTDTEYGGGDDGGDTLINLAAFLLALFDVADRAGELNRAVIRRAITDAVNDLKGDLTNG